MKITKIFAALCALIIMTGCSDGTELGDRAIIQAAAIDYDGEYHVSAMLFSSGGSAGSTIDASQENVIRVTGAGSTLSGAIDRIALADGKRIYMSETKLLILGDGFSEENTTEALETLCFDMRCSLNMPVCCVESGNSASDISDLRFTEGITSADKLLSLIENGERMGVSPKATLLDVLSDNIGGKPSLLPMIGISENGSGMTNSDDGKTAVLKGSRYLSDGVLGDSFDEVKTTALMLTAGKTDRITLNYRIGNDEKTCEAYSIKIKDVSADGRNVWRVSAKFRTRGGGSLSDAERKVALNALTEIVSAVYS